MEVFERNFEAFERIRLKNNLECVETDMMYRWFSVVLIKVQMK